MEQRRIVILGQSKENSYEIRNLLDHKRFELEIALNSDTCKAILTARKMSALIIHTEMVNPGIAEFFEYLDEQGIDIPMLLLGEEASRLQEHLPAGEKVKCFDKPYPVEDMIDYISGLE